MSQTLPLKRLMAFTLLAALSLAATAVDFTIGDLRYRNNDNGSTVTVTAAKNSNPQGAISIPESVTNDGTTYTVTGIADLAFSDWKGLTSATIPKTVTTIGNYSPFGGCIALESITVASGNPKYDSRSNSNAIIETASNTLISGCKNTTIPSSVTAIGPNAFYGCTGLTTFSVPQSVTTIGSYAFSGCSNISTVTIPKTVTSLGENPFENCNGLTTISVASGNPNYVSPSNCNAIIEKASNTLISGCKNTNIPNTVTAIGIDAFYKCSGLTSVNIPSSVKTIGSYAFAYCTSITAISIPSSVTTIGDNVFSHCESMTTVNIPSSVTSLGKAAFFNCNSLTSISIPNSVTEIKQNTFFRCTSLASVSIPNSVTSIGKNAFFYCTSLTSVTIPASVTTFADYVFNECSGLRDIHCRIRNPYDITMGNSIFEGVPTETCTLYVPIYCADNYRWSEPWNSFSNIQEDAITQGDLRYAVNDDEKSVTVYAANNTIQGSLSIPASITYGGITYTVTAIGKNAFYDCTSLTSVTIPNSVTIIDNSAFYKCTGLTSVTIPNSVTIIGYEAFEECSNLKSIALPESVITIGSYAFAKCASLTEVTIPNSVRHLDGGTFEFCSSLTKLVLGTGLQAIKGRCFSDCRSLSEIHALSTKPPYCYDDDLVFQIEKEEERIDYEHFFDIYDNATLFVPRGCTDAYANAGDWCLFRNIVEENTADGDINDDGIVDVTDVSISIDMVLGKEAPNLDAADLDGNGFIDVTDVSLMIDIVLGKR